MNHNKEIFSISKIKKCHEFDSDGNKIIYKTPCDKGVYVVLLNSYWPWFSLEGFKKIN
jgi:hypothetical protein